MRVSFACASIRFHTWESRSELERYLKGFDYSRIVAESDEQELEFYSVTIEPDFESAEYSRFAFGVCSEGVGIRPELLLLPDHKRLLVGANRQVVIVDAAAGTVASQINLDFIFHSMTHLREKGLVVVMHEIGVVVLAEDFAIRWSFSRDVVTAVSVEHRLLRLSFMDSPAVALDLETGVEVNAEG